MDPISFLLFLVFTVIAFSPSSHVAFVLPLIHRNDVDSNLFNENTTDLWKLTHERSMVRYEYLSNLMTLHFNLSPNATIRTPIVPTYSTEYLTKLSIGTPPVDIMLLVDTSSDEILLQCSQCKTGSDQSIPKFDPKQSWTYTAAGCTKEECVHLRGHGCESDKCTYLIGYEDEVNSVGYLGADTFYMNSTSFDDSTDVIYFGCTGEPFPSGGDGVLGLGGGPSSLMSQLGASARFSYCFKPHWSRQEGRGHLYIGGEAPFFGRTSALTVAKAPTRPTLLYFVTLEDISIGSERLNIPPGTFERKPDGSGGTVIDSGSIYTYFNRIAFDIFSKRLREIVQLEEVEDDDPDHLCYRGTAEELAGSKIPDLTLHFSDLDVLLEPLNTFIDMTGERICLVIAAGKEGELSVIGSYAQQNMNVAFDLEKGVFAMAPDPCTTSL